MNEERMLRFILSHMLDDAFLQLRMYARVHSTIESRETAAENEDLSQHFCAIAKFFDAEFDLIVNIREKCGHIFFVPELIRDATNQRWRLQWLRQQRRRRRRRRLRRKPPRRSAEGAGGQRRLSWALGAPSTTILPATLKRRFKAGGFISSPVLAF